MKTTTQLKKEIEEFNKKEIIEIVKGNYKAVEEFVDGCDLELYNKLLILQTKLQTLQHVCEEIENRILYLNKEKNKKGKKKVGDIVYLHIYDMINELKELLKKFQGDEK